MQRAMTITLPTIELGELSEVRAELNYEHLYVYEGSGQAPYVVTLVGVADEAVRLSFDNEAGREVARRLREVADAIDALDAAYEHLPEQWDAYATDNVYGGWYLTIEGMKVDHDLPRDASDDAAIVALALAMIDQGVHPNAWVDPSRRGNYVLVTNDMILNAVAACRDFGEVNTYECDHCDGALVLRDGTWTHAAFASWSLPERVECWERSELDLAPDDPLPVATPARVFTAEELDRVQAFYAS